MWVTIEKATDASGRSPANWHQRIEDGSCKSRERGGRKQVWLGSESTLASPLDPDVTAAISRSELTELGYGDLADAAANDIAELRLQLQRQSVELTALRSLLSELVGKGSRARLEPGPAQPAPLPSSTRALSAGPVDHEALLARIDAEWSGSDGALCDAAGFDRSWLCKARAGRLRTQRANVVKRWRALEAVLDARDQRRQAP